MKKILIFLLTLLLISCHSQEETTTESTPSLPNLPSPITPIEPCQGEELTDQPDQELIDSNCDGIDGDITKAYFVSMLGNDHNAGTLQAPLATIQEAINRAFTDTEKKQVYIANGLYLEQLQLRDGVSLFGGYNSADWTRSTNLLTIILSSQTHPQNSKVQNTIYGELIQTTTILSNLVISSELQDEETPEMSSYALYCNNCPGLALKNNMIEATGATAGMQGEYGRRGSFGLDGHPGQNGSCDLDIEVLGGPGVQETNQGVLVGLSGMGGQGGNRSTNFSGVDGANAVGGAQGGRGGVANFEGRKGGNGANGERGRNGANGASGTNASAELKLVNGFFPLDRAENGSTAENGKSGGGGGGGAGQSGLFVNDGTGNGGGAGGAGGEGGEGGQGGSSGGHSLAVVLINSQGAQVLNNQIITGQGGTAGNGGLGGPEGYGGLGGQGGNACPFEVGRAGRGGDGGDGGFGGFGGHGASGSSVGLLLWNSANISVQNNVFNIESAGEGPGELGLSQEVFHSENN